MHSGNNTENHTFDTDILPWKPNLGKSTFNVSFNFDLKEIFRNYNLKNMND